MKWTNSDNLISKEAVFEGGPNAGLHIPVAFRTGVYRYPDVTDMSGYEWHPSKWAFVWRGK